MNGAIKTQRWMPVPVDQVVVGERQREVSDDHVQRLRDSYSSMGGQLQLQPIVLDSRMVLIDGAHRLEAARRSGWSHIAAIILDEMAPRQRAMLEIEANRVRKNLNALELEQAWRSHYEPAYRAAASERRRSGLRRGSAVPVIGDSDNGNATERISLAKAARQVTGLSIETLNKIAEIRELSTSSKVPEEVRDSAIEGLRRLARSAVGVDSVYRALQHRLRTGDSMGKHDNGRHERERALQKTLERVLAETSMMAERLAGPLAHDLGSAAALGDANREQLRAIRVSLARSLATVVSTECRLEQHPIPALRRLGAEVSRLLSATSVDQLRNERTRR